MLCSGPQKNQQELIYLVICHSVHNYSSISLLLVHDIFRYGWLWLQGWPNQKRWENLWDADRIKMKYNFLFFLFTLNNMMAKWVCMLLTCKKLMPGKEWEWWYFHTTEAKRLQFKIPFLIFTVRVAIYSKVSVNPPTSPISLDKKSIVLTGVNLVTEVEHQLHGYKVCNTCYCLSTSCHGLLGRQTPWRKSLSSWKKNPQQLMFAEDELQPWMHIWLE